MNGTTATECPSHFALDDRELHGGGDAAVGEHPADCPRCRERQTERAADRGDFAELAGAMWTRIAAEARERQHRRRRRFTLVRLPALLAGAGALAMLAVVVRPHRPASGPYVAPKGRALVEIVCRRVNRVFVLGPDDGVAPDDELRFRPLPVWSEARFIQIGSVDGTARYTPFYPSQPGGRSVGLPAGAAVLDGSIRLDAAPGPERLFVVLSGVPLSETAVREVAEANAAAATTVDGIGGRPVRSAWIVLPKRAEASPVP